MALLLLFQHNLATTATTNSVNAFDFYRRGEPLPYLDGLVNDPFDYYRRGEPYRRYTRVRSSGRVFAFIMG